MRSTTAGTLALVMWCASAQAVEIDNGTFDTDLSGWTVVEHGGTAMPGTVSADGGAALLVEGDSLLVQIEQDFQVPARAQSLRFTLTRDPGFDTSDAVIPDAFEARLLDADRQTVVLPWTVGSSAWLSVQQDGTVHTNPDASFDGLTAELDLTAFAEGTLLTLSLGLIGGDRDVASAVRIDDVDVIVDNEPPVAVAGDDQLLDCPATFSLDGSASSDPDGDDLTFAWSDASGPIGTDATLPGLSRPPGTHTFTLTVEDVFGAADVDEVVVTVSDTTAPALTVPADTEVPVDALCGGEIPDLVAMSSASDTCSAASVAQDPPAGTPLALNTPVDVTLTASDTSGNLTEETVVVTLVDPGGVCALVDTGETGPILVDTGDTGDTGDTTDSGGVVVATADTAPTGDSTVTPTADTSGPTADTSGPTADTSPTQPTGDSSPVVVTPTGDTSETAETASTAATGETAETAATAATGETAETAETGPTDTDSDTDPVETDTDETDTPLDSTVDDDSDRIVDPPKDDDDEPGDCGCAQPGGTPTGAAVLALLGLAALRRRRRTPSVWPALLLALVVLPGVARAGGTPVALGVQVDEELTVADEEDRFSFTVPEGQAVFVDAVSANVTTITWRLEDSFGRVLAEAARFQDLGRVVLMGGDYDVVVIDETTGGQLYSFVVHDADIDDGGAFTPGLDVSGSVDRVGAGVRYTFDAAQGDTLGFVARTGRDAGLSWTLIDPAGRTVIDQAVFDDGTARAHVAGTWEILVRSRNANTGAFTFALVAPATDATTLTVDTPVSGELEAAYAEDVWAFTLPTTTRVFVSFPATSNLGGLNWTLLDDQDGAIQSRTTRLDPGGPYTLAAGTYRVLVQGEGTATGTYDLLVNEVQDLTVSATLGDVVSLTFPTVGSVADVEFSALAGDELSVDHVSGSNGAYGWLLLDSDGALIRTLTTSIGYSAPITLAGGDYTLHVDPEGTTTGTAEIGLRHVVRDTTPVSLGAPFSHAMAAPGDFQTYTFTAAAGQIVDLELLASTNGSRAGIRLRDALGRDIVSTTSSLSTISDLALVGGSYTLEILPEDDQVVSWELQLTPTGTSAYVPPAGTPLLFGSATTGTLSAIGATDTYSFTLAQPTTVGFDLDAGAAGLQWTLRDPVGQPVFGPTEARWNTLDDRFAYPLDAGVYTLELTHASDTPSWDFTASVTPPATTTPVAVGDTIAGAFTGLGEEQFFSLDIATTTRVYLDLVTGSADSWWQLIDPAGDTRRASQARFTNLEDAGPLLLTPGSWTVRLDNRGDNLGAFAIDLVEVVDTATSVALGDTISGQLSSRGGTDTYTFDAVDGDVLNLELLAGVSGLRWRLIDPTGQQRFDRSMGFSSLDDVPGIHLSDGTWALVVDHNADSAPAYSFRLDAPVGTSIASDFGELLEGTSALNRIDAYTFTVTEPLRAFVDVLTGADAWMALRDPAGELVYSDVRMSSATVSDRGPYELSAGTWTVEVSTTNAGGPYSFAVHEVVDPGRTVRFERPILDLLDTPGEVGRYTFDVVASGTIVTADLIDGTHRLQWRLVDPVGTTVFDFINADTFDDDFDPISLAAGTYEVQVDGKESSVGDFSFKLLADVPALPDYCDATTQPADADCDMNGVTDVCEVIDLGLPDCNQDLQPDGCQLAAEGDCDGNGLPDDCYACPLIEAVFLVDTSASMNDDRDTLCGQLENAITSLQAEGILLDAKLMGIGVDDANFTCLDGNALDIYGGDVPLDPPAGVETLADCSFGGVIAGESEDWARAVAVAAARNPWQVGTVRVVVPVFDEGPHCGDPLDALDDAAIAHAITVAAAFDVEVHPITGTGTSTGTSALAQALADATGGLVQRATPDDDRYLDILTVLGTDACLDSFDCNRNDIPDSCEIAAGEIVECACGRVPEVCECDGPPEITELSPPEGSAFVPGQTVTVSGRALPSEPGRGVAAVLVNGRAVVALDAEGRFFAPIEILPGEQTVTVEALDRCGPSSVPLTLVGDPTAAAGGDVFADVSGAIDGTFRDTTWATDAARLQVEVAARNVGQSALSGPLLMAVGPELTPGVSLLDADGRTPDGQPYVEVLGTGIALDAQALSDWRSLAFDVPERTPLGLSPRWLVPQAHAPSLTTAPSLWVRAGQLWTYVPAATDPAGHALSWSLPVGPLSMTVDPVSGALAWTPDTLDEGMHDITLAVDDGFGGRATQSFTLEVRPATDNAPPYFLGAPPTFAPGGAAWTATLEAADADEDPLEFVLLSGPAGLTLDPVLGQLSWSTPATASEVVEVEVRDGRGGVAGLSWTLTVGAGPAPGSGPVIVSQPPGEAVAADYYIYQPAATDPDGDVLTWTLATAPAQAAFDTANGRITWAPSPGDVGDAAFVLEVSDGTSTARQAWTVVVSAHPSDLPPRFLTQPPTTAVVDLPYAYDIDAFDPEATAVTYGLAEGPAGMSVDPVTGLVSWTPQAGDEGEVSVAVTAEAPATVRATQAFVLTVRGANAAPVIDTLSPPDAVIGATWSFAATADDADGDLVTWSLVSAPDGMTLTPFTGLLSWTPTALDLGSHTVTVAAEDAWGGRDEATFSLDVTADTTAPTVAIWVAGEPGCLDLPLQACALASDAVGVESVTLAADGVPLALDASGCAPITATQVGPVALTATASDAAGNTDDDAFDWLFVDCDDTDLPVVTLVSPPLGEPLFGPTPLVVDISDNTPIALTWTVEIAPHGTDDWTLLSEGAGEVVGGEVATIDTTLLPNDDYDVRVLASDGANEQGIQATWGVGGDLKLGHFRITFTDLEVALQGIPLSIDRTYDSLDTSEGAFGPGWHLGLSGKVWDTPLEDTSNNPMGDFLNEPFLNDSRVYVIKPSGERVGFTFDPQLRSYPAVFQYDVQFEPDPGVTDTLEAVATTTVWNLGAGFADYIIPWNPSQYVLTTAEGVSYTYDEVDGLILVEDAFGNTIDVTDDGLLHSDGTSIAFERDAAGRITRILEPDPDPNDGVEPPSLDYVYDAEGRLIESRDPLDHATTYAYDAVDFPLHLTAIDDPTGRDIVTTIYDDDGRMVAQCPADGDPVTLDGCLSIDVDTAGGLVTNTDTRGYRSDWFFDADGLLTLERRFLDGGGTIDTTWTYDDAGRILTTTIDGATWTFTRDEQGKVTREEDPDGRVRTATYTEDCYTPLTVTDELGATQTRVLDEHCRVTAQTDRLERTTTFDWNDDNSLASLTDANGQTWSFTYSRGRRTSVTDPQGETVTWAHDETGNVILETDRDGHVVQLVWDDADRLISETRVGRPDLSSTWTWDDGDRMLTAETPQVRLTRTYGPTGRVATERTEALTAAHDVTLTYTWDAADRVAEVADSLGGTTTYSWDELRRVSGAEQTGTGVSPKRVEMDWDGLSRPAAFRRFEGATAGVETLFAFDGDAGVTRLTGLTHQTAGGTPVHDVQLTRSAHDDVLTMSDAEGLHAYTYDSASRLLNADHPDGGTQPDESYVWDPTGNRVSSHRSAGHLVGHETAAGGNLLLQDDAFDYTWTAEGQLATRTDRTTGERLELDWEARGQLVALREVDAGGTTTRTLTFTYDPLGRRVATDDDGTTRWTVWDRGQPILEVDAVGTVLVRRLYGPELDQIWAEETSAGVTWPLVDHVGTVRDHVDVAGAVVSHHVYDSFGVPLTTAPDGPGFQGLRPLGAAGFLDARARVYDPGSGRMLAADPIFPLRYEFAANDPLSLTDPTGRTVAVEYACLAAETSLLAKSFATNIGQKLDAIFRAVAAGFEGQEGDGDGLASALAGGVGNFMTGPMGPLGVPFTDDPVDIAGIILAGGCAGKDDGN